MNRPNGTTLRLIHDRFAHLSFDDPKRVMEWLALAGDAMMANPRLPLLEIGGWKGGTTSMLLELAHYVVSPLPAPPVVTLDPYGDKPYGNPGVRGMFGAIEYLQFKQQLAPVPNHYLFPFESRYLIDHIEGLDPEATLSIWYEGREVKLDNFSFVLVDGEHTRVAIMDEVDGLWPFVADGGVMVVDNLEEDPQTWTHLVGWFSELDKVHPGAASLKRHPAKFDQMWAYLRKGPTSHLSD